MKVLISGAGIAGPTLAYWLLRYGFEPTIVERAPQLRTGGYVIDFWGAGFDIAERMGLTADLLDKGYRIKRVAVVSDDGKQIAGFPAETFARSMRGRFVSIARGDLAAAIFGRIKDRVETIFGDSVETIEESPDRVRVSFENGPARDFDLVIGADGLHSRIRALAFGGQSQFEKYLGYRVAAFSVEGYTPRDELVYLMYTEVGQQIARFAMRGNRTMFLFTFEDESFNGANTAAEQKALLRKRFGSRGWESGKILGTLDSAGEFYFDRVSQIRMDNWSRGRVALLGDAAFCVSLLAGQGSALAMVAAYILAGELHRADGDYQQAFFRYHELFGPFVARKQQAALRFAQFFAPKSKLAIFARNQIMNLMKLPWIAELAMGRDLADKIEIPNY